MRSFFSVICLQLILQCTIDMFGRFILLKFRSFTFVSTCYLLLTAYCLPHHPIITSLISHSSFLTSYCLPLKIEQAISHEITCSKLKKHTTS